MDNLDQLGAVIGKAISAKPEVTVIEPKVTVDVKPIAKAVKDGSQQNAKTLIDAISALVEGVGHKIGEGVVAIADGQADPADLSGVESGLQGLAKALSDETVISGLDAVVEALQAQTAAIEDQSKVQERQEAALRDQIAAIEENTAAIRADRTVSYDGEGRISKMRVIQ